MQSALNANSRLSSASFKTRRRVAILSAWGYFACVNNELSRHQRTGGDMRLLAGWQAGALVASKLWMASPASADCAPYPIAARLGNVTLSNRQTTRGIALAIGTPEQNFAFMPQWSV